MFFAMDLPPVTPQQDSQWVVMHRSSDNAEIYMLGFVAFGADADLKKLDDAAQAAGQSAGRVETKPGETLETMIVFRPGSNKAAQTKLYQDALAGKFGRIEVKVMVVSVADAADGIDPAEEIRIGAPATVKP
ncbi:MAG: hypothetical protein ACOY45_00340 [Pseudomonadota bacterium]